MSLPERESNVSGSIDRREAIKRAALMFGAAVSASTFNGLMAADRKALGAGANWTPKYLGRKQAKMVTLAADLILPKSDTPGAIDVGVPQFIDFSYGKFMDDEEKATFDKGLALWSKAGFLKASKDEQIALLKKAKNSSRPFIRHLRQLTILGYFTSEEVMKNVTTYDPVPGKYVGCVSIEETGNVIMSEPR